MPISVSNHIEHSTHTADASDARDTSNKSENQDQPSTPRKRRSSRATQRKFPPGVRFTYRTAPDTPNGIDPVTGQPTSVTLWLQTDDFVPPGDHSDKRQGGKIKADTSHDDDSAPEAEPIEFDDVPDHLWATGAPNPVKTSTGTGPAQVAPVLSQPCQIRPEPIGSANWQPLMPATAMDAHAPEGYVIIGWDAEYQSAGVYSRDQIRNGEGKVEVLSCQFHAITHNGLQWQGICLPDTEGRLQLMDALILALGMGARVHGLANLPRSVILVSHFNRADIPLFEDFKAMHTDLHALRGSFVTMGDVKTTVTLPCVNTSTLAKDSVTIRLHLRDTTLMTSQASKSLKAIGELIGVPKVELSVDPTEQAYRIRHMKEVRARHWPLFRRYAIVDAEICALYMHRMILQNMQVTGSWRIPLTLTSIGTRLLLQSWKDQGFDKLDLIGEEAMTERRFCRLKNTYVYSKKTVKQEALHLHEALITECYHGGRNEQFWFGPGFEDNWHDYDLSSAYPTAMCVIAEPDWARTRVSVTLSDYKPDVLGFARVEYEFPASVRYPTLPQRTPHGVIFPRSGQSYCAAPEIHLARLLGARLRIVHGVIVPYREHASPLQARYAINPHHQPIMANFISVCIHNRLASGKNTLEGLFWKEICNSVYGKLAQGLKERRIYSMRDQDYKNLPASEITNCAFAAFVTSFTRAVMGEAMNSIPVNRMVFSCTTDGFITNASPQEMDSWRQNGHFSNFYQLLRQQMFGDDSVLEEKHRIRQPLGWRTRGQATLKPGVDTDSTSVSTVILAKAGLSTPAHITNRAQETQYITDLFFDRFPGQTIYMTRLLGLKEMIDNDADFVERESSRELSMEYDWKRRPSGLTFSTDYQHIAFSTVPWDSVAQFIDVRGIWSRYNKTTRHCIKTREDFMAWAYQLEDHTFMEPCKRTYLHKAEGGMKRMRQQLCAAFKLGAVGLRRDPQPSNSEFAVILRQAGIACTLDDVKNGKRMVFKYHHCPSTPRVIRSLSMLKQQSFAELEIEQLIDNDYIAHGITLSTLTECKFTQRVNHPDVLPVACPPSNGVDNAIAAVDTKDVTVIDISDEHSHDNQDDGNFSFVEEDQDYVSADLDDLDEWLEWEMIDALMARQATEASIERDQPRNDHSHDNQSDANFSFAQNKDCLGVEWVDGDDWIELDMADDMKGRQTAETVVVRDECDDETIELIAWLSSLGKEQAAAKWKH